MKPKRILVGVFAKFPQAGRVKTRLAPLLGYEDCARLAEYLLLNTLDRLSAHPDFLQQAELILWTDGGTDDSWGRLLQRSNSIHAHMQRRLQVEGHLGLRMQEATREQLRCADCSVLIGPDAIALQPGDILRLVEATESARIGFIPAQDGGYVAVACRDLFTTLFSGEIPWGTSAVAAITQQRLLQEGVHAAWLGKQPDLDEPEDYLRAMEEGGLLPQNWRELYAP